jgi:hypothetical protein
MPQALIMEANAHLDTLQKQEVAKHLTTFELNGTTYGFIPDWENFSAGEWIDMETYTADFWKTAHKAMSILYRPLDRKWGDTYTIEEYTAKEDAEVFKDMPAPLVAGALLFFWTTERALLSNLQSSLLKATKEAMSSLQSGGGIRYSTHWLVRMSSRWTQLRSSLWGTLSRIWPTSKTSTTSVSNR